MSVALVAPYLSTPKPTKVGATLTRLFSKPVCRCVSVPVRGWHNFRNRLFQFVTE